MIKNIDKKIRAYLYVSLVFFIIFGIIKVVSSFFAILQIVIDVNKYWHILFPINFLLSQALENASGFFGSTAIAHFIFYFCGLIAGVIGYLYLIKKQKLRNQILFLISATIVSIIIYCIFIFIYFMMLNLGVHGVLLFFYGYSHFVGLVISILILFVLNKIKKMVKK